jgi:hypothetical protein
VSKRATFKQGDLTRALKGVIAAGGKVERVEIETDGTIVIILGDAQATTAEDDFWKGF